MPRPKKVGGPEPKKRSRNGCWPCKARKVKCGEEKPKCLNCERQGETCDYSIRLNWEGRAKKKSDNNVNPSGTSQIPNVPGARVLSLGTAKSTENNKPNTQTTSFADDRSIDQGRFIERSNGNIQGDSKITFSTRNTSDMGFSNGSGATQAALDPALTAMTGSQSRPFWPSFSDTQSSWQDNNKFNPAETQKSENLKNHTPHQSGSPFSSFYDHQSPEAYPSPPRPGDLQSSRISYSTKDLPVSMNNSGQMLPPYQSLNQIAATRPSTYPEGNSPPSEHRSKRIRLSPSSELANPAPRHSPHFSLLSNPLTPTASSGTPDDIQRRLSAKTLGSAAYRDSPDPRRLSVNSLLSGPPELDERSQTVASTPSRSSTYDTETYGLDRGFPDRDIPQNNDSAAISGETPQELRATLDAVEHNDFDADFYEFGFGLRPRKTAFKKDGYYAKPVPVKIPKSLEPLPTPLLENPMNLLYFHHFLNHTARILVPHDCPENPFKTILPQSQSPTRIYRLLELTSAVAVENNHLLNLLLAYSASHRARLLNHKEPSNRIAHWVRDVFPTLRHALASPSEQISNATLAAAIMLASLEIISPNTFEVPVPWQHHLEFARRMIIARGGARSIRRQDKVPYFLSRWFAYLDVLGSLSGGKNDQPLVSSNYWAINNPNNNTETTNINIDDDDPDYEVDCVLGFTSRCITILAQIAELARQSDAQRIDAHGNPRPDWHPSPLTISQAAELRTHLQHARTRVFRGCPHRPQNNNNYASPTPATSPASSTSDPRLDFDFDALEMAATNEAYHQAGLIHLERRVLGKPASHPSVQNAVGEIVKALGMVREGGTAEACLLFPMFTAGCEALADDVRGEIMRRVKGLEGVGMRQVRSARRLMERVWEEGRGWETLVRGEFVG
ncbi:MAG: hypothetical protein M1834_006555 [Cirrosporium novae-zelandiae]|nr:MAG: hypothetical protein M1834_006555 [Cirrosporium novae-zelandiae]